MVALRKMREELEAPQGPPAPPEMIAIYRSALDALEAAHLPYLVGGGLAMYFYAAVEREVKDLDLHLLPRDVSPARRALESTGFTTRMRHPQWLAQAHRDGYQICMVFGSGTWIDTVDESWLRGGRPGSLWGNAVTYAPPEEIFCQQLFMCSRVRFDGSDAYHLLLGLDGRLDWKRVLERVGEHWEVLLAQLLFFRYIYPTEAGLVPDWVLDLLLARLRESRLNTPGPTASESYCRGVLLDGSGPYTQAVHDWGYRDARQEIWEERQRHEAQPDAG